MPWRPGTDRMKVAKDCVESGRQFLISAIQSIPGPPSAELSGAAVLFAGTAASCLMCGSGSARSTSCGFALRRKSFPAERTYQTTVLSGRKKTVLRDGGPAQDTYFPSDVWRAWPTATRVLRSSSMAVALTLLNRLAIVSQAAGPLWDCRA